MKAEITHTENYIFENFFTAFCSIGFYNDQRENYIFQMRAINSDPKALFIVLNLKISHDIKLLILMKKRLVPSIAFILFLFKKISLLLREQSWTVIS